MNQRQLKAMQQQLKNVEQKCAVLFKAADEADTKASKFEDHVADVYDTLQTRMDQYLRVMVARKIRQINKENPAPTKRGTVYKHAVVSEHGIYEATYDLLSGRIGLDTAISRGHKTVWKVAGASRCYKTKPDATNRVNPLKSL